MILLYRTSTHYLVACILSASIVLSFPPFTEKEAAAGFGLPVPLNPQGSIITTTPADSSASVQVPNSFAIITGGNPVNLQDSTLSPNQFDLFPAPVGSEITTSFSDNSQNLALLFEGNGDNMIPQVIPSFPVPLLEFFSTTIPQFVDGILQWFDEPEPPNCDGVGVFAFCCEKGAPDTRFGRHFQVPNSEGIILNDEDEISKRRKNCNKWKKDHPACYFPANIFCCDCKDRMMNGYGCKNQPFTNDPRFMGKPIPDPVPIPKRPKPDPKPSTENVPNRHKRDWGQLDEQSRNDYYMDLYAQADYDHRRKNPGRGRDDETCTDEYLDKRGVSPKRYVFPPRPLRPWELPYE